MEKQRRGARNSGCSKRNRHRGRCKLARRTDKCDARSEPERPRCARNPACAKCGGHVGQCKLTGERLRRGDTIGVFWGGDQRTYMGRVRDVECEARTVAIDYADQTSEERVPFALLRCAPPPSKRPRRLHGGRDTRQIEAALAERAQRQVAAEQLMALPRDMTPPPPIELAAAYQVIQQQNATILALERLLGVLIGGRPTTAVPTTARASLPTTARASPHPSSS